MRSTKQLGLISCLLSVLVWAGCADVNQLKDTEKMQPRRTPFEVCNTYGLWQRYGSMDECISEIREERREKHHARVARRREQNRILRDMANGESEAISNMNRHEPDNSFHCTTTPGLFGSSNTDCR